MLCVSVTAAKYHGCRFIALAVEMPASRIVSMSSLATASCENACTVPAERIVSTAVSACADSTAPSITKTSTLANFSSSHTS